MSNEALKLAILKALVDYEKEFCSQVPEWKKELQDTSYMEEMEWISFEQLVNRINFSDDADYIKELLKSMDGDLIEIEWDGTSINGITITSEGAFYWQIKKNGS